MKKNPHDIWEQIRTDWVNGNRKDAANELLKYSKRATAAVIHAAIVNHINGYDCHLQTATGDLTDLEELLTYLEHTL